MRSDLAAGAVTLAIGILISLEARRIPDTGVDAVGPGTFPFFLGLVIGVCGLLIGGKALLKAPAADRRDAIRWHVVGAAFALLFAYSYSLGYIGFPLATLIVVPALLVLLGTRAIRTLAISAIATSACVFLIFGKFLGVDLPTGMLFGG